MTNVDCLAHTCIGGEPRTSSIAIDTPESKIRQGTRSVSCYFRYSSETCAFFEPGRTRNYGTLKRS